MKTLFVFAVLGLLAAPVAVQAQRVRVHYDRSVDFSKFKTYSWIKGLEADNPETNRLIVEDIHRHLQARGLQEVDQAGDVNIAYYSSLSGNINTHAVQYMQGVDWKQWGEHDEVYGPKMVELPIAKIVVDIVDASANKLIWRGLASDAYTPNEARGKKRVNSSIARMFAKYPPPSRK